MRSSETQISFAAMKRGRGDTVWMLMPSYPYSSAPLHVIMIHYPTTSFAATGKIIKKYPVARFERPPAEL